METAEQFFNNMAEDLLEIDDWRDVATYFLHKIRDAYKLGYVHGQEQTIEAFRKQDKVISRLDRKTPTLV